MRRLIVMLLAATWCLPGMAENRGTSFGVSVTVVQRVATRTEAGMVTTSCVASPCISPLVSLGPVDPQTGIRYVTIIY